MGKGGKDSVNKNVSLSKGIFWWNGIDLLYKKAACSPVGEIIDGTVISSHQMEWENFLRGNKDGFSATGELLTRGMPFNHYPRGRVEIARNTAKIFLHPAANCPEALALIIECFGLTEESGIREIKAISDHSCHYETEEEKKNRQKS